MKKVLYTGIFPAEFLRGCEVIHQPMIKIIPVADYKEVDQRLDKINQYDCLIFASRFAAENFLNRFYEKKLKHSSLGRLEIIALGEATANYLKEKGIACAYAINGVKNKRILLPGSVLSSPELAIKLKASGALVDSLVVYQTVKPDNVEIIDLNSIDEAYFLSPWGFNNFLEIYGALPQHLKIKAIGKPALECIIDKGYKAQLVEEED